MLWEKQEEEEEIGKRPNNNNNTRNTPTKSQINIKRFRVQ